ncbi:MAG: hypothetical protein ACFFEE_04335 [Candidatus Thorarchaeota archaeon]
MDQQVFFETLSLFIRDCEAVYQSIKSETNLKEYAGAALMATITSGALYGAVMGLYAGGIQILYDAIKIPMLLLISLFVFCRPTLCSMESLVVNSVFVRWQSCS